MRLERCLPRVCSVARADRSLADQILWSRLQIVSPAHLGEHLDDAAGEVEVLAELGRSVVPGEGVVEVVPSLAKRQEGHQSALTGQDFSRKGEGGRGC